MKLTIAMPVTTRAMDESFGPLGNQRNIVRWAFEDGTDVGAVKRFEVANLGHVIAKLKANREGLMAVDAVRSYIEPILKNKKKAELIKAKMSGSSLEAIAKAVGAPIQQATDVTMDNPVLTGGVGQEPKVVGNAFALATGKLSAPIEGKHRSLCSVEQKHFQSTSIEKPRGLCEQIESAKRRRCQQSGSCLERYCKN